MQAEHLTNLIRKQVTGVDDRVVATEATEAEQAREQREGSDLELRQPWDEKGEGHRLANSSKNNGYQQQICSINQNCYTAQATFLAFLKHKANKLLEYRSR